jgi:hypothetical protein
LRAQATAQMVIAHPRAQVSKIVFVHPFKYTRDLRIVK